MIPSQAGLLRLGNIPEHQQQSGLVSRNRNQAGHQLRRVMVQQGAGQSGHYDFTKIEARWQAYWDKNKTFRTEDFGSKPKYYVLDMFPYPSGSGLHVGHVEGYTATDIVARYKRMKGFNVLHPIGWDAFGLPAEQFAIRTGTHPARTSKKNIDNFRNQIKRLGYSTDWDREVDTTRPDYYRWTQWIFTKLYEKGLAYESREAVNWCPQLGTVLANEEVVDGRSEVGGFPVEKRPLRQWVLKITEYAERLLSDLEDLDWPESTKEMQRNWIGKSAGAVIRFDVKGHGGLSFEVFSTRPDTLFGVTFCILAPEHPLVAAVTTEEHRKQVQVYCEGVAKKSDMDRAGLSREKTGVFTGSYAINPVTGQELPIFIADYVLVSYGSGAVMAVPGHDSRDHEFARKYGLDIVRVLSEKGGGNDPDIREAPLTGDGVLVNSGFLNKLHKEEAIAKMGAWLEEKKRGYRSVIWRLRDWIFSRQRYWGEPFPIAHDREGKACLLGEEDLPVLLPDLDDFRPTGDGEPPLARASSWLQFDRNGQSLRRETNIMPQWAGSCWYYLRYLDPHNAAVPWDVAKERHWMPVDLYVGGVEHANLHLLYARFWHKVLYDLGYVSTKEPFQKLRHQGMILGANGEKMSKSRGNVVNPDEVIDRWGADSLRLYEMFMGPLEQVKPWQAQGMSGVHRFLKRAWRLCIDEDGGLSRQISAVDDSDSFIRLLHKTIKKVSEDTEAYRFNTAISAMMGLVNQAYQEDQISRGSAGVLVLLLAPYAPHIAEELWSRLGHAESLAYAVFPEYDPALVSADVVTISVMVNGKFRAALDVCPDIPEDEARKKAAALDPVRKHLDGKRIVREIFVRGKIVNFVVK